VKSMFSALERSGIETANPLAGFRNEVRVGNILPRTIARTTVRSLLHSTHSQSEKTRASITRKILETALIELLFATRMRVSEAIGARQRTARRSFQSACG